MEISNEQLTELSKKYPELSELLSERSKFDNPNNSIAVVIDWLIKQHDETREGILDKE